VTGPGVRVERVTSEGDELCYEVRGAGPALLMIAGAGGDAERYRLVADLLADEYRVITYDRRATARSTMHHPQNFEVGQQSRDAIAVLHAAGETAAFVFGNSSGGVIALDMVAHHPHAVRGAVVHEVPLARLHPDARKWQRFFARVYLTSFLLGSPVATLRFLRGAELPVRQLLKASKQGRSGAAAAQSTISPMAATDHLIRQELLPFTNYLPDLDLIGRTGVRVAPAAGRDSLDRKRWYTTTVRVLSDRLGSELVEFPGHHGSYLDRPDEWAPVLRRVLRGWIS
jgi:pimeloyl-ACP methyl ester carboxylesterase